MPYDALPTHEDMINSERKELQSINALHKWRTRSRILLAIAIVGLMCFVLLYLYLFHRSRHPEWENCGSSPAEALSLGCSFDVMSFTWIPTRCFDQELMEDFLALRSWSWYMDKEGVNSVDFAAVSAGCYDELYVTEEYHLYHCTYMWRKMHRAILEGRPLDSYIGNINHTEHCGMMLLNPNGPMNGITTTIFTKYPHCPKS
jgi:hypothetical protein